jgi:hypothetical protein
MIKGVGLNRFAAKLWQRKELSGVIWEIILRDFLGAILRPLIMPYRRSNANAEREHSNPYLFERNRCFQTCSVTTATKRAK